ncbi:MAG: hypothetical protein FWG05_05370, partial [Kiritimatiellaeota bacterium]|nr:hypothetical protein [Kiritimatiellota bacterium]
MEYEWKMTRDLIDVIVLPFMTVFAYAMFFAFGVFWPLWVKRLGRWLAENFDFAGVRDGVRTARISDWARAVAGAALVAASVAYAVIKPGGTNTLTNVPPPSDPPCANTQTPDENETGSDNDGDESGGENEDESAGSGPSADEVADCPRAGSGPSASVSPATGLTYEDWAWYNYIDHLSPDDDPDEDGLTNHDEWLLGTDPLLAHTLNPYYTDGELAGWGFDPLAPIDYTAHEIMQNGRVKIWLEQSGYPPAGILYGFSGPPGGFAPWYADTIPAESDENCDIIVDVNTTRSALLKWNDTPGYGEFGGIVILSTTGGGGSSGSGPSVSATTSLRLRLPWDDAKQLRLLPYLGADDGLDAPPELDGEFWIADMRVRFIDKDTGQPTDKMMLIRSGSPDTITNTIDVLCLEKSHTFIATYFPPTNRGGGWGAFAERAGTSPQRAGTSPERAGTSPQRAGTS